MKTKLMKQRHGVEEGLNFRKFVLNISGNLFNIRKLEPKGCDGKVPYHFKYHFKLKCANCGTITQETYVSLGWTVLIGDRHTHLFQKCEHCDTFGTVTMIPGYGRPLTQDDKCAPLMIFNCNNFEPLEFVFRGQWKAESLEGTQFVDIDLSEYCFVEYDKKIWTLK